MFIEDYAWRVSIYDICQDLVHTEIIDSNSPAASNLIISAKLGTMSTPCLYMELSFGGVTYTIVDITFVESSIEIMAEWKYMTTERSISIEWPQPTISLGELFFAIVSAMEKDSKQLILQECINVHR